MAANDESSALQAIKYKRGSLQLLDQRLLPFRTEYLDVPDVKAAWTQIRDMVVRGAPAIGCTGALAMAVELHALKGAGAAFGSAQEALEFINQTLDFLPPHRRDLADACNRLKAVAATAAAADGASAVGVCGAVIEAAEAYLAEDIASNKRAEAMNQGARMR
eukprot:XP_001695926.1 eukaryotic initiation factor [Chlamydomonas reinhardtii]